jgi:ABC-type uncharacterized transport system permease subunit
VITTILLTYVLVNAVCALLYMGLERGHYYAYSATILEARRKYAEQIRATRWTLVYLAPFELIAHFAVLRARGAKIAWMSPIKIA